MRKRLKVTKNPASNKKGFSLIELIIVIAILAVIAAIAVPNLLDNINKSRIQTDVSNAKLIANSVAQVLAEDEDLSATVTTTGTPFESDSTDSDTGVEEVIETAAAALQSVPTVKYVKGFATSGTANADKVFSVVITSSGVISVYGDSGVTSGSQLFPEVGANWVLE